MKIVLDTNVLIAAFIARGVCTDVFERVIDEHELLLSPFILKEFERVMVRHPLMSHLARRFVWGAYDADDEQHPRPADHDLLRIRQVEIEAGRCLNCDARKFEVVLYTENCKDCGYCVEVCGVDTFGPADFFNTKGYRPMQSKSSCCRYGKTCIGPIRPRSI